MRALLGKVPGLSRRESEAALQSWKNERAGAPAATRPRPQATRRPAGAWTELTFHVSDAELGDWDRLRDLLSHRLGTRDPQAVLKWLVELGLDKLDPVRQTARKEKRVKTVLSKAPEAGHAKVPKDGAALLLDYREASRQARKRIPADVRRRVCIRFKGRCQYVSPKTGLGCGSTAFVDVDHGIGLAEGGSNDEHNLTLACSNHNRRRPFWKPEDQPLYAAMLRGPAVAGETEHATLPPS